MNSGIMDVHNLAFRIASGLSEKSLEEYSAERTESVKKNMAIANALFGTSMNIAKTLGLDIQNLKLFENVMQTFNSLPFGESLFKLGLKAGTLHLESNLLSQKMARDLAAKKFHIPLILLDNEFQQELEIPQSMNTSEGSDCLKNRKLFLLPNRKVTLYQKVGGSFKELPVSDIRNCVGELGLTWRSLNQKLTGDSEPKEDVSSGSFRSSAMNSGIKVVDTLGELEGASDPKDEASIFVLKSTITEMCPKIPESIECEGILLRSDGYVEILN